MWESAASFLATVSALGHQASTVGVVAITAGALFGLSILSSKASVDALEKVQIANDALQPRIRETLLRRLERRLRHARLLHGIAVFAGPISGGSGALGVLLKSSTEQASTTIVAAAMFSFVLSIVCLFVSQRCRDTVFREIRQLQEDIDFAKRARADREALGLASAELARSERESEQRALERVAAAAGVR